MPIDPEKFNTDPKHEKEREHFDALLEGSLHRIGEKRKKANPENKGFIDEFLSGLFGDGK